MPKCKINGVEVEVKAGATIIEAFKQMGVDIAHYCWHPGLSVAGVCRLCMVQIEGVPKLQIACNTEVKEGMVINNDSPAVKEAVKWGLDFHLINHPLDCPICDQAGECGLQDQYMQYGKYDPEMAEPKVRKRKVVDLGPTVVLDSERCILCSRCVRFTEEVSKTHELGIFNRGDRSEIGTFEGKPLANNYSLNTVDICPVGALTSKDFRFRQRVWYLKEVETICTGCSTGCNIKAYYNEEGLWRVKPRPNPDVNGYWMCDWGRNIYKFTNKKSRLMSAEVRAGSSTQVVETARALRDLKTQSQQLAKQDPGAIACVMTGQYSLEEYQAFIDTFVTAFGSRKIYHWINNPETFDDFDGLLFRGDKNPNTKGLLNLFKAFNVVEPWDSLVRGLKEGKIKTLYVVGPENQAAFTDIAEKIELFSHAHTLVWMAPGTHPALQSVKSSVVQIPLKTFVEKEGTYINFQGREQRSKFAMQIVPQALSLVEVAKGLAGEAWVDMSVSANAPSELKQNYFTTSRGPL